MSFFWPCLRKHHIPCSQCHLGVDHFNETHRWNSLNKLFQRLPPFATPCYLEVKNEKQDVFLWILFCTTIFTNRFSFLVFLHQSSNRTAISVWSQFTISKSCEDKNSYHRFIVVYILSCKMCSEYFLVSD